ncbi:MAG: type II toxin-antitoxin system Phd/YefM family antitoxin [Candidatus Xenobia bacterium]
MKTVGIRDLKNHLSEYIRLIAQGQRVLVTDHGKVVAELIPPEQCHPGIPQILMDLARQGRATLGKPDSPGLYPDLSPIVAEGTVEREIDEMRGT